MMAATRRRAVPADAAARFGAILAQMVEEELACVERLNRALHEAESENKAEEHREEIDIHLRRVEALRAGMDCLTW